MERIDIEEGFLASHDPPGFRLRSIRATSLLRSSGAIRRPAGSPARCVPPRREREPGEARHQGASEDAGADDEISGGIDRRDLLTARIGDASSGCRCDVRFRLRLLPRRAAMQTGRRLAVAPRDQRRNGRAAVSWPNGTAASGLAWSCLTKCAAARFEPSAIANGVRQRSGLTRPRHDPDVSMRFQCFVLPRPTKQFAARRRAPRHPRRPDNELSGSRRGACDALTMRSDRRRVADRRREHRSRAHVSCASLASGMLNHLAAKVILGFLGSLFALDHACAAECPAGSQQTLSGMLTQPLPNAGDWVAFGPLDVRPCEVHALRGKGTPPPACSSGKQFTATGVVRGSLLAELVVDSIRCS
jgi:hypothetical protein